MIKEINPIWYSPSDKFGYFAWPSIARLQNGLFIIVASGYRLSHICPCGKLVYFLSENGIDWSIPYVLADRPIDQRDPGITTFGEKGILISWVSADSRGRVTSKTFKPLYRQIYKHNYKNAMIGFHSKNAGNWIIYSEDLGLTWSNPIKVPVHAPHGPIVLKDGSFLYLGRGEKRIEAHKVLDIDFNWEYLGTVPGSNTLPARGHYAEPHVIELSDGRLLGHIRWEKNPNTLIGYSGAFSIRQTISEDGGKNWSRSKIVVKKGSPPHLMRHSSGAIICTYGNRYYPYAIDYIVSSDEGKTWAKPKRISEDAYDTDMGYPASVETDDGILTVYYQKVGSRSENCGLFATLWKI